MRHLQQLIALNIFGQKISTNYKVNLIQNITVIKICIMYISSVKVQCRIIQIKFKQFQLNIRRMVKDLSLIPRYQNNCICAVLNCNKYNQSYTIRSPSSRNAKTILNGKLLDNIVFIKNFLLNKILDCFHYLLQLFNTLREGFVDCGEIKTFVFNILSPALILLFISFTKAERYTLYTVNIFQPKIQ